MPLQISQVELSQAYSGKIATRNVEKSLNKIATGKKLHSDGKDSAAYAQSIRMESQQKHGLQNLQNLQNLISYSQAQEGALNKASGILDRMGVLATQSLDIVKNDRDRENYNKEFQELAKSLGEIEGMKFNDLDLFSDGPFSEDKKTFISVLQSQWLNAAEQVVKDRLGLEGNNTDTFKVVVNDQGDKPYNIQIMWNYTSPNSPDKETDVTQLTFEMYNYSTNPTAPPSDSPDYWSDRLNAIMMTYAVMANNFYFNAMANGEVNKGGSDSGGAEWFKSGVADFVHGGDLLVWPMVTQNQIDGVGNGDTSPSRESSYLAVRYLHEELKTQGVGASAGLKDMLMWMSDQVKVGKSAQESSIGAALKHFIPSKYTDANTANDEFISDFKTNGLLVLHGVVNPLNTDSGAISGHDADGGDVINHKNAVPDHPATDPTTTPLSNFEINWEKEGKTLFSDSSDGSSLTFNAVNTITVGDTDRYNLKSINSAKLTLSMIETWTETLNAERSQIGANIQRLRVESENQTTKYSVQEFALSRIADVDLAEESTNLSANKIRVEASMTMLAQAQKLNVGVPDLIGNMQIGKR
jgi:flagellin-like hook-associated protein FlgL